MERELFGPCLTVYPYPEARYAETLELCDSTSPYALTGSIFARRPQPRSRWRTRSCATRPATSTSTTSPPGAVVAQQPFGGGRASGTNDKAGWSNNLMRWSSPRTVKETSVPPTALGYPHMEPDSPRVTDPAEESTAPGARRRRLPRAGRRRATGRAHARRGRAPERGRAARARRARRGRGRGLRRRELCTRRRRARGRRRRGAGGRRGRRCASAPPDEARSRRCRADALVISFLRPLDRPEVVAGAGCARRERARDGAGAAHHARADDGRALLAGHRRRLPRRAGGRDARCRASSRC